MERRRLVGAATLAALAWPRFGVAQGAAKAWRVGYLSMASPDADRRWVTALRRELRDLGHVEGRNLLFEQRYAYNQPANVPDLAATLLRLRVDVLVVHGSPAIEVLRKAAPSVPVVMTAAADPVGSGFAKSLARPGGNLTGLTDGPADLAVRRLELLKEVAPRASRVAALLNPETAHAMRQWKLVQAAAPRLGLKLLRAEIRGADGVERAFDALAKERADALLMIPDPSWRVGQERRVAELALKNRLASIGSVREFAEHGMLAAYGPSFAELWRRGATYVDRILKGARPGDLAIEHPSKLELVINLQTAKALGIAVPRAVVQRADQVIE